MRKQLFLCFILGIFVPGIARSSDMTTIQASLTEAGVKCKVDDDGDVLAHFTMDNDKGYLVWVSKDTFSKTGETFRQVCGQLKNRPKAADLTEDQLEWVLIQNGKNKFGGFGFLYLDDSSAILVRIPVPANADGITLKSAMWMCASLLEEADNKIPEAGVPVSSRQANDSDGEQTTDPFKSALEALAFRPEKRPGGSVTTIDSVFGQAFGESFADRIWGTQDHGEMIPGSWTYSISPKTPFLEYSEFKAFTTAKTKRLFMIHAEYKGRRAKDVMEETRRVFEAATGKTMEEEVELGRWIRALRLEKALVLITNHIVDEKTVLDVVRMDLMDINDAERSSSSLSWSDDDSIDSGGLDELTDDDGIVAQLVADMATIPGRTWRMGKHEVTQKQWKALMGSNPSAFKGDNRPVENVSWQDVQVFLENLNALAGNSGLTFRLPDEKEWEYACKAGSSGEMKLKNGTEVSKANIGVAAWTSGNSNGETHAVGLREPNAFGLYDMFGNVWEMTETGTDYSAWGQGRVAHPRRPCGSSFQTDPAECTLFNKVMFNRSEDKKTGRDPSIGFRLCADVN